MSLLRTLPALDRLLHAPELEGLVADHGAGPVKAALRTALDEVRAGGTAPEWAADPGAWASRIAGRLRAASYRPVFNLTGTVIHTNLGRSTLSPEIWDAVRPLVTSPMNLEFDLATGKRGSREGVVVERLVALTGAEAATIVNNNAAALLLALNTLALGSAVPVSRGELIEIGGSFRLPDLMQRSGCSLLEVGTTNRTHLRDFEAVAATAALLLKVHPSNYRIEGFTREVGVRELAGLAHKHGRPLVVDLGSGSLIDLERHGLPHETTPQEVLAQGADLVTFSGDKLLGSVQAGLVVGRRELVARLDANPLKRALRADKVTLALLDATLKLYEQPDRLRETLPLLRALTVPAAELERRARCVLEALVSRLPGFDLELKDCAGQIGSGALPGEALSSRAVVIGHGDGARVRELAARLRALPRPVIARLHQDRIWLDVRGAEPLQDLCEELARL